MLGIVKAGAILVNVNYRYVEGELRYLFENSDMVALVHERQYSDRVANVLPETPDVKTILVVEDGSDNDFQRYGGVEFYSAIAQSSPERDFGPRSADDIYLLYTGDRKSTRLNSSHMSISYAVFCLKKKKKT